MKKRELLLQIAHGVYIGIAVLIVLSGITWPVYQAGYHNCRMDAATERAKD